MEPGFLVAAPQLRDPNFARSVVLLVHHDGDGALGVIVNRPTPVQLGEVLEREDVCALGIVMWGGPVDRQVGLVVFQGSAPEGWQPAEDVAVSGSRERLDALAAGEAPFLLCLGYAGWGPGQLDAEFEEGSWIHVDLDAELLFRTPSEERYDVALARLGLTASRLMMVPGEA